ncbi:sodium/proline symporter [Thalassotalea mangrovi]|uniref:Sodium/proline symporter n=1 Tax=Thalassotalea mangrovi TaxID=2572245 RepID=A0A4U1B5B5_9GAMM|nr:sodium/proline symporter [Thalassotalea mangrovi]TKB45584.1 sodium/proline symporter [Thalassotalea mangrovi]
MDYSTTVLVTLIAYKLVLIAIGFWSQKRTKSSEDYFIGGRRLGPWVAAVSSAASASSAWTLLGMSGAAYTMGVSAIWIVPAVVLGYCFNWIWIAPRLQQLADQQQAITLSQLLANQTGQWRKPILYLSSFCIVFSFTFYIAAQFQAAGNTFASTFDVSMQWSIITGALIILIYTLLGGFWAVSITDTLQGLLMAVAAVVLPVAGLLTLGGPMELWQQMHSTFSLEQMSITGPHQGLVGLAFVIGLLGIGLGNPGQPHVVNRMMALRDSRSVHQAKVIAIGWSMIVISGMLILGWCAKVIIAPVSDGEQALLNFTNHLFPAVVAGIMIAAILSAIMSTADSQLLVSAAAISYDVRVQDEQLATQHSLLISRLTVVVMCMISVAIALFAPKDIFSRVLFAWNALGAAFGPLLIVRLLGHPVSGRASFAAMFCGFFGAVILSMFESPPGDYLERIIPFGLALYIAYLGRVKEPALSAAIDKPGSMHNS